MANATFKSFRRIMGTPGTLGSTSGDALQLVTDTFKFVLVDHGTDTPVPATDDFLDDIGAGARVSVSASLAGLAYDGATWSCTSPTVFTSVTGATAESLVLYKHTGTDSTSALCIFYDTLTGLVLTPNGANVNVTGTSLMTAA